MWALFFFICNDLIFVFPSFALCFPLSPPSSQCQPPLSLFSAGCGQSQKVRGFYTQTLLQPSSADSPLWYWLICSTPCGTNWQGSAQAGTVHMHAKLLWTKDANTFSLYRRDRGTEHQCETCSVNKETCKCQKNEVVVNCTASKDLIPLVGASMLL